MTVNTVQHGQVLTTIDTCTTNVADMGLATGNGSFTMTAAGVLTVADANVNVNSTVVVFPTNAAAGLLVKGKSCWIGSIAAGSFVFNCSSTGAGAPAGTETFGYIARLGEVS